MGYRFRVSAVTVVTTFKKVSFSAVFPLPFPLRESGCP